VGRRQRDPPVEENALLPARESERFYVETGRMGREGKILLGVFI